MDDSPTKPQVPAAGQGSSPPEPDLLARTEPLPDPGGTEWTVPSYIKEIANPQHPSRLGRYRIRGELGAGGMGQVFLAHDDQLGRTVALKIIRGVPSPLALDRFIAESRALARFDHPGIARVFDAGQEPVTNPDRVIPYFVMEHVPGAVSLTKYAAQHNLSIVQRIALLLKICDAVRYAHERGVIHRDLKPSNIILSADAPPEVAQPKIIDFGVAMVTDETQTHSGRLLAGTLEYMSPEQSGSAIPDTRADLYALGVILYELLTGTLPITVPVELGTREAVRVIRERAITPLREAAPWLGDDLDAVISRTLNKDPDRRYATVDAFADDLRRVLDGRPISIRREPAYRLIRHTRRLVRTQGWLCGLAIAALLALGGLHYALEHITAKDSLNIAIERLVIHPRQSSGTAMNAINGRLYAGTPAPGTRGVVLVEADPDLDLAEFGPTVGIHGITPETPNAARPFLALLLDRLADAGAAVTMLDYGFFGANERFDPILAAAAQRFTELRGTRPVSAASDWADPQEYPPLPPTLTPWFLTGGASALLGAPGTFATDVAIAPQGRPALPSIALLTAAQAWHAGFDLSFERAPGGIETRFHRRPGSTNDAPLPRSITVPVAFSMDGPVNSDDGAPDFMIGEDDSSRTIVVQIPERTTISAATISLSHALTCEPEALASRVRGAVVVVGNPRTDLAPREEFYDEETADGTLGRIAGFEAQASAVALLLGRRSMSLTTSLDRHIIISAVSLIGFVLAHLFLHTWPRRVVFVAAAVPAALLLSFLGVYLFDYYALPWLYLLGLVAGVAASVLVRALGATDLPEAPTRAGAAA
ncbi:MAG: serine/threonine protein kinase [Phycisphaeraceae bacterium]|nr:serine/threonine protein kinase [Phycisphaeraceae bacterium]